MKLLYAMQDNTDEGRHHNQQIKKKKKENSSPPSAFTPAYLRYTHVVRGLLVRVDDGTRHGPHGSESLHVLIGEDRFTLLPPQSQSHVQRLCSNNSSIHFSYCFCCFLGRRETDKAEAFALGAICHDLREKQRSPQFRKR